MIAMTLLEAISFAATFFIFCCLGAWRIFEHYLARLEKKMDEIIDKLNKF